MSQTVQVPKESWDIYSANRRKLPPRELAKHTGKWVAFSRDGRRIVASALTPAKLIKRLEQMGQGAEDVVLGRISRGETSLGGAELG